MLFGLGALDYLTIETDGSYHTSDILKVAFENASYLGMDLSKNTIEEALNSDKVKEYNHLLSIESLPPKCKNVNIQICAVVALFRIGIHQKTYLITLRFTVMKCSH